MKQFDSIKNNALIPTEEDLKGAIRVISQLPAASESYKDETYLLNGVQTGYSRTHVYRCELVRSTDSQTGDTIESYQWVDLNIGTYGVGNCTNFTLFTLAKEDGNTYAYLRWKDPQDIIINETSVAEWEYTKLVVKADSEPISPEDGTVIETIYLRDKYATTSLRWAIPSGDTTRTYYFKLFPVSKEGVTTISSVNCRNTVLNYVATSDAVPMAGKEYFVEGTGGFVSINNAIKDYVVSGNITKEYGFTDKAVSLTGRSLIGIRVYNSQTGSYTATTLNDLAAQRLAQNQTGYSGTDEEKLQAAAKDCWSLDKVFWIRPDTGTNANKWEAIDYSKSEFTVLTGASGTANSKIISEWVHKPLWVIPSAGSTVVYNSTVAMPTAMIVYEKREADLDWQSIKQITRNGNIQDYFQIGDVITLPWHGDYGYMQAEVVGFNAHQLEQDADGSSFSPSMTLQLRHLYFSQNRKGAVANSATCVFDPIESGPVLTDDTTFNQGAGTGEPKQPYFFEVFNDVITGVHHNAPVPIYAEGAVGPYAIGRNESNRTTYVNDLVAAYYSEMLLGTGTLATAKNNANTVVTGQQKGASIAATGYGPYCYEAELPWKNPTAKELSGGVAATNTTETVWTTSTSFDDGVTAWYNRIRGNTIEKTGNWHSSIYPDPWLGAPRSNNGATHTYGRGYFVSAIGLFTGGANTDSLADLSATSSNSIGHTKAFEDDSFAFNPYVRYFSHTEMNVKFSAAAATTNNYDGITGVTLAVLKNWYMTEVTEKMLCAYAYLKASGTATPSLKQVCDACPVMANDPVMVTGKNYWCRYGDGTSGNPYKYFKVADRTSGAVTVANGGCVPTADLVQKVGKTYYSLNDANWSTKPAFTAKTLGNSTDGNQFTPVKNHFKADENFQYYYLNGSTYTQVTTSQLTTDHDKWFFGAGDASKIYRPIVFYFEHFESGIAAFYIKDPRDNQWMQEKYETASSVQANYANSSVLTISNISGTSIQFKIWKTGNTSANAPTETYTASNADVIDCETLEITSTPVIDGGTTVTSTNASAAFSNFYLPYGGNTRTGSPDIPTCGTLRNLLGGIYKVEDSDFTFLQAAQPTWAVGGTGVYRIRTYKYASGSSGTIVPYGWKNVDAPGAGTSNAGAASGKTNTGSNFRIPVPPALAPVSKTVIGQPSGYCGMGVWKTELYNSSGTKIKDIYTNESPVYFKHSRLYMRFLNQDVYEQVVLGQTIVPYTYKTQADGLTKVTTGASSGSWTQAGDVAFSWAAYYDAVSAPTDGAWGNKVRWSDCYPDTTANRAEIAIVSRVFQSCHPFWHAANLERMHYGNNTWATSYARKYLNGPLGAIGHNADSKHVDKTNTGKAIGYSASINGNHVSVVKEVGAPTTWWQASTIWDLCTSDTADHSKNTLQSFLRGFLDCQYKPVSKDSPNVVVGTVENSNSAVNAKGNLLAKVGSSTSNPKFFWYNYATDEYTGVERSAFNPDSPNFNATLRLNYATANAWKVAGCSAFNLANGSTNFNAAAENAPNVSGGVMGVSANCGAKFAYELNPNYEVDIKEAYYFLDAIATVVNRNNCYGTGTYDYWNENGVGTVSLDKVSLPSCYQMSAGNQSTNGVIEDTVILQRWKGCADNERIKRQASYSMYDGATYVAASGAYWWLRTAGGVDPTDIYFIQMPTTARPQGAVEYTCLSYYGIAFSPPDRYRIQGLSPLITIG